MPLFNADLHIHTCLSPCGDLDMSPVNIVKTAKKKGIDIIAITDHNTTHNVQTCVEIGKDEGVFVIPGCEVNTQEEVHCLAYFPDLETLNEFQRYLDEYLPDVKNDVNFFGYQVAVDKKERIIYEEQRALFMGIEQDIESVEKRVHALGGIFVPAHIDRVKNSVFSQLGFIPFDLQYDALEISWRVKPEDFFYMHPELAAKKILRNSDAHYLPEIGKVYMTFDLEDLNWNSFERSIKNPQSNE